MSQAAVSAHPSDGPVAHHFESRKQQFEAGKFGMWAFLVTELLFFGGLFVAYAVYRQNHTELFQAASNYLDTTLGAVNTVVLLVSSLTMAWGVRCAQLGQKRGLLVTLTLTLLCATTFMVIKGFEYEAKIHHGLFPSHAAFHPHVLPDGRPFAEASPEVLESMRGLRTFFGIYFCMTGLHGLHVLIGMGLITWLLIRAKKGHFGPKNFAAVDFIGLYWHLVDLIWIFLFPLLYLIG
jgi:cytochrome c oxidase subunit 3